MASSFDPYDLPMSKYNALRHAAGTLEAPEICARTGLSPQELEACADAFGWDLEVYRGRAEWCDECLAWRVPDPRGGCPVCRQRGLLEGMRRREAAAWAALTPARRADVESRQQSLGIVRAAVMGRKCPRRADYEPAADATPAERRRAADEYALAVQGWECARLLRERRAANKRCERLERYGTTKSNGAPVTEPEPVRGGGRRP